MENKKTVVIIGAVLIVIIGAITIKLVQSNYENTLEENYRQAYGYNNYTQKSDREIAMEAVYANGDEFASKAYVSDVSTIVISDCSKRHDGVWIAKGHFYGKDAYGNTKGVYNFTCYITVSDGYTNIFGCEVEEKY